MRKSFALLVLLLSQLGLAGEPYAFRIMSNFQEENKVTTGHGLCVPVESKGKKLILTALHVANGEGKDPSEILVDYPQGWIRCRIVRKSEELDLCLLQPMLDPPFVVKLSKNGPKNGQAVLNPNFFASMKMTTMKGMIQEKVGEKMWVGAINGFSHGSSGSPVLDEDGKIIGLSTAGVSLDGGKTMIMALFVGRDKIKEFLDRKD